VPFVIRHLRQQVLSKIFQEMRPRVHFETMFLVHLHFTDLRPTDIGTDNKINIRTETEIYIINAGGRLSCLLTAVTEWNSAVQMWPVAYFLADKHPPRC